MRTVAASGAAVFCPDCSADMGVSVAEQAYALLQAGILGGVVGLLYDCFRVLRVRIPFRLLGGLLDFLFWVAVTALLFYHAITAFT